MAKMHTRTKRNFSLTSSFGHKNFGSNTKTYGARTFSTEEAAKAYAKEHDLKGSIVPAKKGKRFKIE